MTEINLNVVVEEIDVVRHHIRIHFRHHLTIDKSVGHIIEEIEDQ